MESQDEFDQFDLITVKEAARLTRTAEGTWRHWLMGGVGMPRVRVIRIGRTVRIHRQDLLNWIAENSALVPIRRRKGRPTKAEQIAAARQSTANKDSQK